MLTMTMIAMGIRIQESTCTQKGKEGEKGRGAEGERGRVTGVGKGEGGTVAGQWSRGTNFGDTGR